MNYDVTDPSLEASLRELESAADYSSKRNMPAEWAIPSIKGIDIYGRTIPYNGRVGGDILSYMNFSARYDLDTRIEDVLGAKKMTAEEQQRIVTNLQRLKRKGGILVADVAGHSVMDSIRAHRFDEGFKMGADYELDIDGEITPRLFEKMNMRFCKSGSIRNLAAESDTATYVTAIYGEIAENGMFRFLCAGHPLPLVFSREFDRFVDISEGRFATYVPFGLQPSENHFDRKKYRTLPTQGYKKRYDINEINLMNRGDILLLYTDGFLEKVDDAYDEKRAGIEQVLKGAHDASAKDICDAVIARVRAVAPPTDDLTLAVIKRG